MIFFSWTLETSIGQKPQFPVFLLSHDDFHFESGIQDIIKFFATLRDNLCTYNARKFPAFQLIDDF